MQNGKVYIGQSVGPFDKRMAEHMRLAEDNSVEVNPKGLHAAIREFGIESFSFEILERCNNLELNSKEKEYIAKYNSFSTGYNLTSGGGSIGSANMNVESVRDAIVSYIDEGLTLTEIASRVGVSLSTIKRIAEANGIKILNKENGAQGAKAVIQYDNNWRPIRYCKSISESYNYIDAKLAKISTHQHNVRIASTSRRMWLGYHWALADDLVDIVNGQKIMFRVNTKVVN